MWRNSPTTTSFQGSTTPLTTIHSRLIHLNTATKATSTRNNTRTDRSLCVCVTFIHTYLWALKSFSSRCLLCWIGLQLFFISHVFISTLTFPSAIVTRQWVGENGNSKAVDPVVTDTQSGYTNSTPVISKISFQENNKVLPYTVQTLVPHRSDVCEKLMKIVTLHWTQGIVSRHQGSDPHTECSFVEAEIKN